METTRKLPFHSQNYHDSGNDKSVLFQTILIIWTFIFFPRSRQYCLLDLFFRIYDKCNRIIMDTKYNILIYSCLLIQKFNREGAKFTNKSIQQQHQYC